MYESGKIARHLFSDLRNQDCMAEKKLNTGFLGKSILLFDNSNSGGGALYALKILVG